MGKTMFKNIVNAQWIWFSGVYVLMFDFFPASAVSLPQARVLYRYKNNF